jgi:hypothetical protein
VPAAAVIVEDDDVFREGGRGGKLFDLCEELSGGLGEVVSVSCGGTVRVESGFVRCITHWKKR